MGAPILRAVGERAEERPDHSLETRNGSWNEKDDLAAVISSTSACGITSGSGTGRTAHEPAAAVEATVDELVARLAGSQLPSNGDLACGGGDTIPLADTADQLIDAIEASTDSTERTQDEIDALDQRVLTAMTTLGVSDACIGGPQG